MKTTLPALLFALVLAGPAQAAISASACNDDAKKFCPNVKPGGGAIDACLRKNEKSLSPGCQQLRQEVKQKVTTFAKACGPDAQKHCANVQPGEGRVLACLKQNEAKLGADCKSQMQPAAR